MEFVELLGISFGALLTTPTEYFYSYGCMPIAPKTSARMYTIREYTLLPLLSPCISPPVPVFFPVSYYSNVQISLLC